MRIRVVDAFSERAFAGNPAGVCLLGPDGWPDAGWMQRVAAELNLAETAFAYPTPLDADADWGLRWFTPLAEVDLCGHATLATAHVLGEDTGQSGTVRFSSRSGVLVTHRDADGEIVLDFPRAEVTERDVPDGFAEALGAKPEAVFGTGALRDLLAVLPDEAAVRGLEPDMTALLKQARRDGLRGVIVTAPATSGAEYDYVSRFFAPVVGIPEDPVTGSAHTALAPYWARRLGRDGLVGLQASARTGSVRTSVHGDRVHLAGRAVTVLDGTLLAGGLGGN
ncbi:MAG TPA: PhzF family phenazine biosynthesis protein [Actinophytocola sp.]|uniref:PhzF family phenazine biosynthesis protein n=1 Tax=Actinophytocola sp. TaxID=1872138 RepID=UPI002DBD432F|nr:PhzF family phenazine biosynthesis protein [Actinophytocola sp.]HEU5473479.1 PhzF family phenazine biosynthesis protein [Actinophytocola sp.]